MKSVVLSLFPFVILALAASAAGAPAALVESDYQGRADIEKLIHQLRNETVAVTRLEGASAFFLDRAFEWGPLGEGKSGKYDNEPRCRVDKFDCTTYVETVLAVVPSHGWDEFKRNLNLIRYRDGEVEYLARLHFPSLDWIPNLTKDGGLLVDITEELGGRETPLAKTTIKKAAWAAKHTDASLKRDDLTKADRAKLLVELKAETKDLKDQPVTLPYIPFGEVLAFTPGELRERQAAEKEIRERFAKDRVEQRKQIEIYRREFLRTHPRAVREELLKHIPNGVVVNYVHPERPLEAAIGTNMLVTHQGFLFWKDGTLYARHASLNDRVRDIPFLEYIDQFTFPGRLEPQGFNLQRLE